MTRSQPPDRVLVVQTSYLGDLVLATPVFAALKQFWPRVEVAVLARPEAAPILRDHPDVDEVIVDDKRGRHHPWMGRFALVRELRRRRFDLALVLHRSARTAMIMALTEIPVRVGFRQSELSLLYHRRVWRNPALADVERQLSILDAVGVPYDGATAMPRLVAGPAARQAAERQLAAAGVAVDSPFVVVAPCASWLSKRWMPERFAEVVRRLLARGEQVVLVGAAAEVAAIAEVRRLAGGGADLSGRTDAAALAAVIARAAAVICNDSAPMHVADALAVPLVAVIGPTSEAQGFRPRSRRAAIVGDAELTCRPLCHFGGRACPLGTQACLDHVTVDDVLAALDRVRAAPPDEAERPAQGRGVPVAGLERDRSRVVVDVAAPTDDPLVEFQVDADRVRVRDSLRDTLAPLLRAFLDGRRPADARLLAGGRGETISVSLGESKGRAVLRRNLRGGLPARVSRDVYVGFAPRPFAELEATERLRSAGIAVPEPLAAVVRRVGPALYRGAVATREVEGTVNLWYYLRDEPSMAKRRTLCAAAVALVDRLLAAGAMHPDLNLQNFLVGPEGDRLWLIDCDGLRFTSTTSTHRRRALARLRRSAARLDPGGGVVHPAWFDEGRA